MLSRLVNFFLLSKEQKNFVNNNKKISGSDLSNIALSETKKKFKNKKIKLLNSNALNVSKWANWILKNYDTENDKILISMWFIIHEISKKKYKINCKFS